MSSTARQLGPGLGLTVPLAVTLVPFISQIRNSAIGVLREDVGMVVAVEVPSADLLQLAQDWP